MTYSFFIGLQTAFGSFNGVEPHGAEAIVFHLRFLLNPIVRDPIRLASVWLVIGTGPVSVPYS